MRNRVVHFEIYVDDVKRAIDFYTNVFGWKMEQWGTNDYWMVMTAEKDSKEPGINGGLLKRPVLLNGKEKQFNAFICTIQVESIDETISKIEKFGGSVDVPKFAFPGMAYQAYYKDTEGNVFGIHQTDSNAK
jgi:predicted enzyme related to lactoylglutathione lyase